MLFTLLQTLLAIHGIWSAWGYNRGNWGELARLLHRNGYDTVFFCAAYGPDADRDGLQECLDACGEYGIDVHAWVVMWKTDDPADSLWNSLAEENRLQLSVDGDPDAETWMCPADPENVQQMASLCLDLACEFPVNGIHLDYIRYSSDRVCFCDRCRERFSRESGNYGIDWPEDCYRGGRLHDEYDLWRSMIITEAVEAVRDSLENARRDVELSAAVLPREEEMSYFGQQWSDWLEKGIVDFVVPMNYTQSDSELALWGRAQLRLARGAPLPCGLINYGGGHVLSAAEIAAQQNTALEMGFDGYVIFHLSGGFISILRSGEGPGGLQ